MQRVMRTAISNNLSGIFKLVMMLILVICNLFLIRQNWQLRAELNKRNPGNLQRGDFLEPVSGRNSNGEAVSIIYNGSKQSKVFMFFSPR